MQSLTLPRRKHRIYRTFCAAHLALPLMNLIPIPTARKGTPTPKTERHSEHPQLGYRRKFHTAKRLRSFLKLSRDLNSSTHIK